jgi:hypothetical protein
MEVLATKQSLARPPLVVLKISSPIGQHEWMPMGGDGQILFIRLGPHQEALLPE